MAGVWINGRRVDVTDGQAIIVNSGDGVMVSGSVFGSISVSSSDGDMTVTVGESKPRIHPNGGGRITGQATVDETAYVGPDAHVSGQASVTGNARIEGHAHVSGQASVSGDAVIADHGRVSGMARVTGRAQVREHATVSGMARLGGDHVLTGSNSLSGMGNLT